MKKTRPSLTPYYVSDHSYGEIRRHTTPQAAALAWFQEGDWASHRRSIHVTISVYALDEYNEPGTRLYLEDFALHPKAPRCRSPDGKTRARDQHLWKSPTNVVDASSHAKHGNALGDPDPRTLEACQRCGSYRSTTRRTSDPSTEHAPLEFVEYFAPDPISLAWVAHYAPALPTRLPKDPTR